MAFDLTCLATVQANRQSASSCSVGCALGDDLQLVARDRAVVAVLHQEAAGDDRDRLPAARGSGSSPVSSRRRFFFVAKIALRLLVGVGATTTSVKISVIASAVAASSGRLVATMPPNAETLSHASASLPGVEQRVARWRRRKGWRA